MRRYDDINIQENQVHGT